MHLIPRSLLLTSSLFAVLFTAARAGDSFATGTDTALIKSDAFPYQSGKRVDPFILGADITFLLEDEAAGAEYYDQGVKKDFFQILKDNKFNYVRVPSVVEPTRSF